MTATAPETTGTLAQRIPTSPAASGNRRQVPLPAAIQFSYTTRFTGASVTENREEFHLVAGSDIQPAPGDVVVARVLTINNHKRVETPESRKAILFEGAVIALAYGNRYAADQFLAHVPDNLDYCHLVAAGGIAGLVTQSHASMEDPTLIEPLGLLATSAGIVNIRDDAPHHNPLTPTVVEKRPTVIAVLGTSMNSGKSTTMACLANGLTKAGQKVAAGKITGTGAGNDRMIYHDAGAHRVIDFTDFGYATTFKLNFEEIRALSLNMVAELAEDQPDTVLVEIADGIYQEETAQLLRDGLFQETVDLVVFSATDALGASAGVDMLQRAGLKVAAATGLMTASPLAAAEATAVLSDRNVPVAGTYDLCTPAAAMALISR